MTFTRAIKNSSFKQNQHCIGVYCGKSFAGVIGKLTRATVDGKNITFHIVLDYPINVYGRERTEIEIDTNSTHSLYLRLK